MKRLLELDPTLENVYRWSPSTLSKHLHLPVTHAHLLSTALNKNSPSAYADALKKANIHVIPLYDPAYPQLLKQIYDPPWLLYAKGKLELLQTMKLAVVGTRKPSSLAKQSLVHLLPPLITKKLTIVSGLAKGVDGMAHKIALHYGGNSIAVLGSGLLHVYPKEHTTLFHSMAETDLLVTEYAPNVRPQKWQFPARNRVISGLSIGVMVVEAAPKSGSLITADQALEQGREVFAVPGPVGLEQAAGTNKLIQQGACLLQSAEDVLQAFPHLF